MPEPTKCPRCGTEGCPTIIGYDRYTEVADIACSLRAQTELLRKIAECVTTPGSVANNCFETRNG